MIYLDGLGLFLLAWLLVMFAGKEKEEYVSMEWLQDLALGRKDDLVIREEPWTGVAWFWSRMPRKREGNVRAINRVR